MDKYETIARMIREARLELPSDEEDELARQVVALLENVEVLAALKVDEGPGRPAVRPEDLRADEPGETLDRAAATANAPDSGDGYVAVPKVLRRNDDD